MHVCMFVGFSTCVCIYTDGHVHVHMHVCVRICVFAGEYISKVT